MGNQLRLSHLWHTRRTLRIDCYHSPCATGASCPAGTRIEHQPGCKALRVPLAVVASCYGRLTISTNLRDWKGMIIAGGAFALALSRKVNILIILGLAGLAGYLLYR